MTYIELINNFWTVRRIKPMTAYEADFYFYLLKECNARKWLNPFELPSRNVELELGISRKTICDLRNKLQQKGLIEFKEGKKKASGAIYKVLYVSEGNENGNVYGNINGNINGNENGNPFIKKKNKIKDNIDNSNELFAEAPQKKKNAPKPKKVDFIPPTLEAVKNHFNSKLPDWENQATTFYEHFTSLGWRTAAGAKIERWDSRANLWIMEKQQANGNDKNSNARNASKKDSGAGITSISFG